MNIPVLALTPSAGLHATTHATWFDWVLMVGVLPLMVVLYQIWATRDYRRPTPSQAALQAVPPLILAVVTAAYVFVLHGAPAGTEFTTGFTVELSLSFDNVFAWFLVVSAFALWRGYQGRLVVWGVLIAIVLRVIILTLGQGLIAAFWPISLLLVLLLVKLGWGFIQDIRSDEDDDIDPRQTRLYRAITKVVRVAQARYGLHLFTREEGGLKITFLGLAVVCLGGLDLAFAFDSIPAILAIAQDPFIILSSNILAVLFLQSLYFLYEAMADKLTRIAYVLPVIMFFVAAKILVGSEGLNWMAQHVSWWHLHSYEISSPVSLAVIGGLIVIGVVWSLVSPVREPEATNDGNKDAVVPAAV